MTEDTRPHSRACGWRAHPHGPDCHPNCPTCGKWSDQEVTRRKAADLK